MTLSTLTAISPIDGRYHKKTHALSGYFSEYALIYYRLMVEIRWFISLSENPAIIEVPEPDEKNLAFLEHILEQFDEQEALKVKAYEKQTNHDVKAVEYYLREKLEHSPKLHSLTSFIHFACTSEDI